MRCGLRSNLRQIRPTVDSDRPLRRAIEARDQCVASRGISSRVAVTTSSTLSSRTDGGRPGRFSSCSPSSRPRDEPAPPARHVVLAGPQLRGDGLVLPALRAGQHDLRPQRQHLRRLPPPRPPGQLLPLGARQHEVRLPPPWARGVREPGRPGPGEPRAPLPHRLNGKPQLSSHPGIPLGRVRAGQHDPGALLQAAVPGTRQPLKLSPVLARQRQRRNRKRHNNSIEINVVIFRRMTLVS